MSVFIPDNPFLVGKYDSRYFCDRKEETERLLSNLTNGLNTVLLSPRRMGKTGLIRHLFSQPSIRERFNTVYVDIFATQSLEEFVFCLGQEVFSALSSQESWRDRILRTVRSWNFTLSVDPKDGTPSIGFAPGDIKNPELTLAEIFELLDASDRPTVIAVDEFQQILRYKSAGAEALLRSRLQFSEKVNMIFSGSEMHTLSAMFSSYARPFYQSAAYLQLEPIDRAVYHAFAVENFRKYDKRLPPAVFHRIYEHFDGRTWYVQMLLNQIFAATLPGGEAAEDDFSRKLSDAVCQQSGNHELILRSLTPKQRALLFAVARENGAREIFSADFCFRNRLGSPATVQSAARALSEKGFLAQRSDAWYVEDYFFLEWLRATRLKDPVK